MKKMPTLFHREFQGHQVIHISPEVVPGLEWVLNGDSVHYEASFLIEQRKKQMVLAVQSSKENFTSAMTQRKTKKA